MVNLINCGKNEFIKRMREKKLYCFGAGKYLQHFIDSNYGIAVEAIIDNYSYLDKDSLYINGKAVDIISLDSFVDIADENSAIIITCLAIEEILEQLDSIKKLEGLECYVEFIIDKVTEPSEPIGIVGEKVNRIPQKIHYCWFGENPLPDEAKKCIESWKKYCPDYEIIRWDESNYDIHKNQYISQAYEQKKWAFVSDYARVDILYNEGGIYFDTDVEVIASFDEFLRWDLFCGFECKEYVAWGLGFGAVKGHEILKSVMRVYENMPFIFTDGTLNMKTCPQIQSEVLGQFGFTMNGKFQVRDNVALYPRDVFAPFGQYKCLGQITKNTHSIHHYTASWFDSVQQCAKDEYEKRIERIIKHNETVLKDDNYSEQNDYVTVKKYQIWECISESGTAGSKAPMDVKQIVEQQGYQVINIHHYKGKKGDDAWNWSHRRLVEEWKHCYDIIPENSILFLQHPFWQEQQERNDTLLRLKNEKHVRIISLVHDVECLRETFLSEYMRAEFDFMLSIADVLIVHNNRMRDYFISIGVEAERLVCLEVFDYLFEDEVITDKIFEHSVNIAGNLDGVKSPYIGKIQMLKDVNVHLYGPNYVNTTNREEDSNVIYHGAFPANHIPQLLNCGFGLIWDGENLETCTGNTGVYLKYNNPHKLSLYLAAGLPVFIWKEAATAEYVVENGLGIAISSLYEIEEQLLNIKEVDYQKYVANVAKVSGKIRNGLYTIQAIDSAEKIV